MLFGAGVFSSSAVRPEPRSPAIAPSMPPAFAASGAFDFPSPSASGAAMRSPVP